MKSALKSALLKLYNEKKNKNLKNLKNHGLPKFASGPPLGGRPDVNSGRP